MINKISNGQLAQNRNKTVQNKSQTSFGLGVYINNEKSLVSFPIRYVFSAKEEYITISNLIKRVLAGEFKFTDIKEGKNVFNAKNGDKLFHNPKTSTTFDSVTLLSQNGEQGVEITKSASTQAVEIQNKYDELVEYLTKTK